MNEYFFSLLYAHGSDAFLYLKEKYAKNMKSKKNQNAFKFCWVKIDWPRLINSITQVD